jgi:hypothetical protein
VILQLLKFWDGGDERRSAALPVREINRADGGDTDEHQNGGEQDKDDQGNSPGLAQAKARLSPSRNRLSYQ